MTTGTMSFYRKLSDREFKTLSALVTAHTGITLGPDKRSLLQARLAKRLRALNVSTFTDYHRALIEAGPSGDEFMHFIDAVTTNKTEFYREAHHFSFLAERWVPKALARGERGGRRSVRIWSAGCSTGEEPYSIAMTLADAFVAARGWNVRVLASDINTDVLEHAAAGVYRCEDVAAMPRTTLTRHFLRGTGPSTGLVQLRPELRCLVAFRHINLVEPAWPIRTRFDVIFCRNVLIYFDRPTQQRVLDRLVALLEDDGVLILGHSEGMLGMVSGLRHVGNTTYRKEVDSAGHDPRR